MKILFLFVAVLLSAVTANVLPIEEVTSKTTIQLPLELGKVEHVVAKEVPLIAQVVEVGKDHVLPTPINTLSKDLVPGTVTVPQEPHAIGDAEHDVVVAAVDNVPEISKVPKISEVPVVPKLVADVSKVPVVVSEISKVPIVPQVPVVSEGANVLETSKVPQVLNKNSNEDPCDLICTKFDYVPICATNDVCLHQFPNQCVMETFNCKHPDKSFKATKDDRCQMYWLTICSEEYMKS